MPYIEFDPILSPSYSTDGRELKEEEQRYGTIMSDNSNSLEVATKCSYFLYYSIVKSLCLLAEKQGKPAKPVKEHKHGEQEISREKVKQRKTLRIH